LFDGGCDGGGYTLDSYKSGSGGEVVDGDGDVGASSLSTRPVSSAVEQAKKSSLRSKVILHDFLVDLAWERHPNKSQPTRNTKKGQIQSSQGSAKKNQSQKNGKNTTDTGVNSQSKEGGRVRASSTAQIILYI